MANRRPLDQAIDAALGELAGAGEVRKLTLGDVLVAREHRRAAAAEAMATKAATGEAGLPAEALAKAWTCACRACRACRAVLAARKRWQELGEDRSPAP